MTRQKGTRSFFLSYLLGTRIELPDQGSARLLDVITDPGEPPRVRSFVVKTSRGIREIGCEHLDIEKIDSGKYRIRSEHPGLEPAAPVPGEVRLGKHLLDRQIVDLDGAKVVRVNDVRLALVESGLFLVAVDVSFTALLRRMGLELVARRILPGKLLSRYIAWNEMQAFVPSGGAVKLASSAERLRTLHPSELADIIEDLDVQSQVAILDALGEDSVVEVIEEMEPEAQVSLLSHLGVEKAADVLEQMDADEVADIMDDLPAGQAEEILQEMEDEVSAEVRGLMEYDDDQVGSLMSTEYLTFPETTSVGAALEFLRSESPDSEHMLAVFALDDKSRLSGVVPLAEMVKAAPETPLCDLGMERLVSVRDDDPIRDVVRILSKYRALSVPVLDRDDNLVGAVTVDDVLADLIRAGGKRLRG